MLSNQESMLVLLLPMRGLFFHLSNIPFETKSFHKERLYQIGI